MSGIRVTYSGLISFVVGLGNIFVILLFTLIMTRTLSPEEFGIWGLINNLLVYVLLIEPIISHWVTREIARGFKSGKTAIFSSGIFSIVGVFVYIIITYFVGKQTETDYLLLSLASIMIPVMFVNKTLTGINLGFKPHVISYGSISSGMIQIPMAIIFIYFLDMGISGAILTVMISNLTSIIVLSIYAGSRIKEEFRKEFLKKWLRLSWIPLYPGLVSAIYRSDIVVFTIITNSVTGIAFWLAALSITIPIAQTGTLSRAVYPKLLEDSKNEYLSGNLMYQLYFGILFTAVAISFSRPSLFALNPIYENAFPIAILLSVQVFFNIINTTFQSILSGIEKVDIDEKATLKNYIKSKFFSLPTIRLIQYAVYICLLTALLLLFSKTSSQLELLVYWSVITLIVQFPLTIYFYILVRKNVVLKLDVISLIKYLLTSIVVFSMTYILTEHFLDYKNNIFEFLPNLLLFIGFGMINYLLITYLVDLRTRKLFKSIIQEIKNTKL